MKPRNDPILRTYQTSPIRTAHHQNRFDPTARQASSLPDKLDVMSAYSIQRKSHLCGNIAMKSYRVLRLCGQVLSMTSAVLLAVAVAATFLNLFYGRDISGLDGEWLKLIIALGVGQNFIAIADAAGHVQGSSAQQPGAWYRFNARLKSSRRRVGSGKPE